VKINGWITSQVLVGAPGHIEVLFNKKYVTHQVEIDQTRTLYIFVERVISVIFEEKEKDWRTNPSFSTG
jgi:hypothetical protein